MTADEDVKQELMPGKRKSMSDDDKRRKNIVPGGLMKALLRPGGGDTRPSDGDQVIIHSTIRTVDGVVVESTRSECGGKGVPLRHVLGKSKMILGLLEGIPTMLMGEVAVFKMKSKMHYGEPNCPVNVSNDFPKDADLHFEIELRDFHKAKVVSSDLGVIKKVLKDGQGWETPRQPYEVEMRASVKAADGEVILAHKGELFCFTLGKSEVPQGLEMGIGTMTKGEKAILYVAHPYLTQSPFLPNIDIAEMHFEVELVHFIQVRDVLGDGRLIKRRLRDGNGEFPMDCPLSDSLLHVHYKGMMLNEKKTVFYDTRVHNEGQPLEFSSGEGLVPEGFEMCVRLMLPGEIALVTCPPDYAYDKFPRPANVPEAAYIQWEIELLDFESPKDWTGLDFRGIMQDAEKIRCTGNRLFKEGKFELAKAKYDKVLREYNHVNPQDDDEGKEFVDSRNMLHLNMAACFLKLGECQKSVDACNKVLELNPAHVKALYRRGMAYMTAGDFEEARTNFEKMKSIDMSAEREASAALLKLKQNEQEAQKKARKQFKGLFDKKPGEIADASAGNEAELPVINESDDDSHDVGNVEELREPPIWRPFYNMWPRGKRFLAAVGLHRCSIL